MRNEPVPGERSQAAFGLHDAALIVGADFAMIANLDYLFDSDVMAVLEGEIPGVTGPRARSSPTTRPRNRRASDDACFRALIGRPLA